MSETIAEELGIDVEAAKALCTLIKALTEKPQPKIRDGMYSGGPPLHKVELVVHFHSPDDAYVKSISCPDVFDIDQIKQAVMSAMVKAIFEAKKEGGLLS